MSTPFTAAEFFDVMRAYNSAVWPAQVLLYALGMATALLASMRFSRTVSAALALLWTWMALVYHFGFFSAINPLAYVFGAAFLAAAALFAWEGLVRRRLRFRFARDARGVLGIVLLAYALVAYPLLGDALGHDYPAAATFGLPCPTTIFTIGLLAFAEPSYPRPVLVVPLLWTLVGAQAAFLFGMREDLALLAAGAAALWLAFPSSRQERPA